MVRIWEQHGNKWQWKQKPNLEKIEKTKNRKNNPNENNLHIRKLFSRSPLDMQ